MIIFHQPSQNTQNEGHDALTLPLEYLSPTWISMNKKWLFFLGVHPTTQDAIVTHQDYDILSMESRR